MDISLSRRLGECLAVVDRAAAIWFHPLCSFCGLPTDGRLACEHCAPVTLVRAWICAWCLETMPMEETRCGCLADRPLPTRSLLWLDERNAHWARAIKFGRRREWLSLFRPAIRTGFRRFFPSGTALVPVPLSRERLWQRGFNQSEWLAREIAGLVGEKVILALARRSGAPPQSVLSWKERQKNVARVFEWTAEMVPSRALIIDDIFTSGATLKACASALRKAGCGEIYGWTLLRVPTPRGG